MTVHDISLPLSATMVSWPGDPAVLVGSSQKAVRELGWKPHFTDLETIIETAWNWHKSNPRGYRSP